MAEFVKNFKELTTEFVEKSLKSCKEKLLKGNYAVTDNRDDEQYKIQKIYALCVLNTGKVALIWLDIDDDKPKLMLGIAENTRRWKIKAKKLSYITLDSINSEAKIKESIQQLISHFTNNYHLMFIMAIEYLINKDTEVCECIDSDDNQL